MPANGRWDLIRRLKVNAWNNCILTYFMFLCYFTRLCVVDLILVHYVCTMTKIAKEFLSLAHCIKKSGPLCNRATWTAYLFINIVQKHQNNIYSIMSIICLFSFHMNISVHATFLSSLAPVLSHQPRIPHCRWLKCWRSENSCYHYFLADIMVICPT